MCTDLLQNFVCIPETTVLLWIVDIWNQHAYVLFIVNWHELLKFLLRV
jgi:hypothetical protein